MQPQKLPNKRKKIVFTFLILAVVVVSASIVYWYFLKDKKFPYFGQDNQQQVVKTYYETAKENAKNDSERLTIDFGLANAALLKKDATTARSILEPYKNADLNDESKLVFYATWGRLLALEQKYPELAQFADEVLASEALKAYPDLPKQWEDVRTKAQNGQDPFVVVPAEEGA